MNIGNETKRFLTGTSILIIITILLAGCVSSKNDADEAADSQEEMLAVAEQAASMFDYYDEISAAIPNAVKGDSEIGGQCGDYALAFVNLWNAGHDENARLVIQQQGLEQFPDGIYKVVGKDSQELPFLEGRTVSMLYIWNNVAGIAHPELGGYKIELVEEVYFKSHFGIPNWENNGPHVWAIVGDVSVDPTFADIGNLPVIGYDQ